MHSIEKNRIIAVLERNGIYIGISSDLHSVFFFKSLFL